MTLCVGLVTTLSVGVKGGLWAGPDYVTGLNFELKSGLMASKTRKESGSKGLASAS